MWPFSQKGVLGESDVGKNFGNASKERYTPPLHSQPLGNDPASLHRSQIVNGKSVEQFFKKCQPFLVPNYPWNPSLHYLFFFYFGTEFPSLGSRKPWWGLKRKERVFDLQDPIQMLTGARQDDGRIKMRTGPLVFAPAQASLSKTTLYREKTLSEPDALSRAKAREEVTAVTGNMAGSTELTLSRPSM